jgi:DNA-binding response OmpR family regulator
MPQILVVEDDADIAALIAHYLDKAGYGVETMSDGGHAVARAREEQPDLVVLDLMLPGMSGLEICKALRADNKTAALPIIMLTARGEESERILGLDTGADDYVVKPFSLKELAARCRVALRRTETSGEGPQGYRDENFEVEFDSFIVRYRGQEIRLTHKEFELFRYMVERAGRVLTRERLMERVWGYETDVESRSIDAHIRRLRLKLGPARHHVETIVGLGYRFVSSPGSPVH